MLEPGPLEHFGSDGKTRFLLARRASSCCHENRKQRWPGACAAMMMLKKRTALGRSERAQRTAGTCVQDRGRRKPEQQAHRPWMAMFRGNRQGGIGGDGADHNGPSPSVTHGTTTAPPRRSSAAAWVLARGLCDRFRHRDRGGQIDRRHATAYLGDLCRMDRDEEVPKPAPPRPHEGASRGYPRDGRDGGTEKSRSSVRTTKQNDGVSAPA